MTKNILQCYDNLKYIRELIEVAFFISKNVDAAGAEETFRKGKMPKEEIVCKSFLGRTVKSCMTVIESDGALSKYSNY